MVKIDHALAELHMNGARWRAGPKAKRGANFPPLLQFCVTLEY